MDYRNSYLHEKASDRQDKLIRELQRNLTLLEQQNRLQKELIASLQEENRMLQGYLERFADIAAQKPDAAFDQEPNGDKG